jgi:4-hydroxythreonine-4-phosphate dehydrogenase
MSPLALTMGDPAGIGGEIAAGAWRALHRSGPAFFVVGDPDWLRVACGVVPLCVIEAPAQAASVFPDALPVLPIRLSRPWRPGHPDAGNAHAVIASIERATRLALDGAAGAVVTNPISKAVLYDAGFAYPGHTEFLAALTGVSNQVMMLVGPSLRVVPITVHVALRQALERLTTQAVVSACQVTAAALRLDFGLPRPRLAIAGLNPHAGEGGALGDEEQTILAPAIALLRAEGLDISGPWPPDTMFTPRARAGYDVAMCMYHDQALIPLKTLDMEQGVNVTLGLPIVRTSPDHGTAFDIAGTGRADPSSLIAALRLAGELAKRRSRA